MHLDAHSTALHCLPSQSRGYLMLLWKPIEKNHFRFSHKEGPHSYVQKETKKNRKDSLETIHHEEKGVFARKSGHATTSKQRTAIKIAALTQFARTSSFYCCWIAGCRKCVCFWVPAFLCLRSCLGWCNAEAFCAPTIPSFSLFFFCSSVLKKQGLCVYGSLAAWVLL